jgi:hypothetical protein
VGGSGDGGIDVEARRGAEYVVIQCKRYKTGNKVGSPQVRNFIGSLHVARANRGYLVTTSSFTEPAIQDAQKERAVDLVDGDGIVQWWAECEMGPFKNLSLPKEPTYPPPPQPGPLPKPSRLGPLGFTVRQWTIFALMAEIVFGVWAYLIALVLRQAA